VSLRGGGGGGRGAIGRPVCAPVFAARSALCMWLRPCLCRGLHERSRVCVHFDVHFCMHLSVHFVRARARLVYACAHSCVGGAVERASDRVCVRVRAQAYDAGRTAWTAATLKSSWKVTAAMLALPPPLPQGGPGRAEGVWGVGIWVREV
jgi:hypothetical protein